MKTLMQITIIEGVLVLTPQENLLEDTQANRTLELLKSYVKAGTREVVLNLAKVNFMNSAGLNQLLLWAAKLNAAGGEMTVCNVSEQAKKLFQMTNLGHVFTELPDERTAIEYSKNLKQRLEH